MKTNLCFRVLLASALIFFVSSAFGQTITGTITGEVTDPSGAVVPGASVVAQNLDTGVATATTTNSDGLYHIDFLPIGHYQVTVQANGFARAELPPFSLEVQQTAKFDVKLTVGSATTNVSVSAAAPILNTDDPTIGSIFTANTISNLPLNGLDFSAVTLYMPGAVTSYGTSGPTSIERSTFNSDTPNFNGNRSQANNYTIDGIDMNETYNNLISYSPAPAAIEEMRVVTANSPTDQGNVNGAAVELVLKSGTNQFHGSAYGYVQNYRFNANSYLNGQTVNSQGQPAPTPINPSTQSQFGGTIGGPIKRNKLFFFADYLGARQNNGGFGKASVIPDAMRSGDFSVLLNGPNPIQLYNSLSASTVDGQTVYTFEPYSGDTGVPIVNPVAKFLFANPKLYPDCGPGVTNPVTPPRGQCLTATDGIANNNYEAPYKNWVGNDQGDVKLEYDMRPGDKITGFYSNSHAYNGSTAVLDITFPSQNLYPTWLTGAEWTHTFSPSLVNAARIGFTRTDWDQGVPEDPTGLFGTAGDAKVGISFPNQRYNGFTNQGLNNGLSDVGTTAESGLSVIDNTYTYADILTWQRGKHFLSMGIDAKRYQNNYPTGNNDGYLGSLNYSGNFTSSPYATTASGYGPADFVLDRVSSGGVTLSSVNVGQRQWRAAGFAQDSFKLLPNLTLVFGLRYEYDEPWVEEQDRTGNINLATGQIEYAGHLPVGALPNAAICSNTACYQPNYRQWMPHLGFAYQLSERAVIRGGYGAESFFEGNSYNQRLTAIAPFLQSAGFQVSAPTATSVPTPNTAEEGFTGSDTGVQYSSSNNGYTAWPQNMQPAYVQEWNFTAEYALTHTLSLQAGYVGEQGQHIEDYGNVNQLTVNNDQTSAPFYNSPYIGVNGIDSALGVGGNGGLLITESRAMMNYNALQAVVRQRLSHGLEYTVNYTWGKAMTNSIGNYSLFGTFNNANYGYSGAFQNYYNSHADYGPAGYDVTHNISAIAVYALPVGRGRQFLSGANRVTDEIVGGWKLSTAIAGYSGFPEVIIGGSNNSNSYGSNRVNQYRRLKIAGRSNANWFGTDPSGAPCLTPGVDNGECAFGIPANNVFGTESNGAFRGPGYFNTDLSAFKDFHTIKEQTIGFRFDDFNAFNIVSYGNPDTGISDSDFGNVSLQIPRSTERHLQFALHYNF
jgi:Carboxypeptidase regulatory-like domain